jgi:cellulose synthase (UDP-forming)
MEDGSKLASKSKNKNLARIPLWTKAILGFSVLLFLFIFIANGVKNKITLLTTGLIPAFRYLEFLQPPTDPFELLLPTIIVVYICILLYFIPSNNWNRLINKIILLILLSRYLIWRITTLNLEHWASTAFSLFVYAIELFSIFTFIIYSLQLIWSSTKKRSIEANKYIQEISFGKHITSVDVLILTENKTEQAIYRTVVGCQAMDYPTKKVYILDSKHREYILELANKLGCEYIANPHNKRTKAENINEVLAQTNGELILIMDAGSIPLKNFLMRTIGYFEKPDVALVQTSQALYNSGQKKRNLIIQPILIDIATFWGFSQSCRDFFNSVLCHDCYVVRRTALESVGDLTKFCGESLTSVRILTLDWRIIYLNEVLSIKESIGTYLNFIDQQVRWHYCNYQIFSAGGAIPIWSKLDFWQKGYFFTLCIHNFAAFFRAVFIFLPIVAMFLGTSPIVATPMELIYYLVPYLWLVIGSYSWSTEYAASFFRNEISQTILCYPLFKSLIKSLIFAAHNTWKLRFSLHHHKPENKNYHFGYKIGLLISIIAMVAALCWHLIKYQVDIWKTATSSEFGLIFIILLYNIVIVGIALFASVDQSEKRTASRFFLQTGCRVVVDSRIFIGYTNNLSEGGAEITLIDSKWVRDVNTGILKFIPSSRGEKLDFPVGIELLKVDFLEHNLSVEAKLLRSKLYKNQYNLALKFINISLEENRQLIKILYCDFNRGVKSGVRS